MTSLSPHTTHSRRPPPNSESVGDVGLADAGGDGLEGNATPGNDQIEEADAVWDSNDGDSPSPSSLSMPAPQIATRSFIPGAPELLDELLQLPLLENAPLDPFEPFEPGGSRQPRIEPKPPRQSTLSSSESSRVAPVPVLSAMCASISRLAASTLSGSPVTSNTGSLSRLGVTM